MSAAHVVEIMEPLPFSGKKKASHPKTDRVLSAFISQPVSLLVFGSSNHQITSTVRLPDVANHDWAVPVLGQHANRGLDRHIRAPVLDNSLYLSGIDLE